MRKYFILIVAVLIIPIASEGKEIDPAQLIGRTIADAIQLVGLEPKDCIIFDEPPGVARGVICKIKDGQMLHLWIKREDGLFNQKRNWTFVDIGSLKIQRVKINTE